MSQTDDAASQLNNPETRQAIRYSMDVLAKQMKKMTPEQRKANFQSWSEQAKSATVHSDNVAECIKLIHRDLLNGMGTWAAIPSRLREAIASSRRDDLERIRELEAKIEGLEKEVKRLTSDDELNWMNTFRL